MAVLSVVVPIAFGMIALAMFATAYFHRGKAVVGKFDLFFCLGHLFVLGCLMSIYNYAGDVNVNVATVVFPVFLIALWMYVIIVIIILLKFLQHFFFALVKTKGKGYMYE